MTNLGGQLAVWLSTLAGGGLIIAFWRKLPKKLAKAILTSFMFVFTAVLFINYARGKYAFTTTGIFVLAGLLIVAFTGLSFGVVYCVKDEEKQRKIFFAVAAIVFGVAYFKTLTNILSGHGGFPSHLCRQISYGFPLVYFSKYARKWMLPFWIYASIVGSVSTLFVPDNILQNAFTWGDLDTLLVHITMFWVSITLLVNKEVKPKLHDLWQFLVGLFLTGAFALFSNWLEKINNGSWGNGMYLKEPPLEGFPTWLFTIIIVLVVYAIIIPMCHKEIKTLILKYKKRKQNKTKTN